MKNPYEEIINLPRRVSDKHPQMLRENRAAQFAPFAALTGYDAAIKETARLTDERIELGESAIAMLEMKLGILYGMIAERPEVSVTYFRPDEKKDGGAYVTVTGAVKKIDEYERVIAFMDGTKIAIADILEIDGEVFEALL